MQCPGAEAAAGTPIATFDSVVSPLQAHQCVDSSYDVKAGESLGDRAERLLYHLADFTGARLANDRSLPADFKVSLQLVEYMGQQAALLHEVNTKLEDMRSDFFEQMHTIREDLLADMTSRHDIIQCSHEEISKQVQNVSSTIAEGPLWMSLFKDDRSGSCQGDGNIRRDLPSSPSAERSEEAAAQQGVNSNCRMSSQASESVPLCIGEGRGQKRYEDPEQTRLLASRMNGSTATSTDSVGSLGLSSKKCTKSSKLSGKDDDEKKEPTLSLKISNLVSEKDDDYWLKRVIVSNYFEWACASVIITNAVTIGIQAQESIEFAVKNPGTSLTAINPIIAAMNKIYITFYTLELFLKLVVFGGSFFCGANRRWNLFDFVLVLTGIYDLMTEVFDLGGGMNVTGLRVLRIVKTLKLLRVVKVMRFFQVLRRMVSSIAGSMTTLFWSILMIGIMMYMFGLCFLQAIVGFLNDNKANDIPLPVMEGIESYWSSVEQAMMTLFWAVTGGADWEPLAAPIRASDSFFFSLFFFYIAFAAFAVLNVLTGMFVDTAMKVAQEDEEAVADELLSLPKVQVFRESIYELNGGTELIGYQLAGPENRSQAMLDFQNQLEIDHEDCARVFDVMTDSDKTKEVDLEEFILGCCHAKGSPSGLDMQKLLFETKHIKGLVAELIKRLPSDGALRPRASESTT